MTSAQQARNWDDPAMTTAEHVLNWAENSAPHHRQLCRASTPGNFHSVHMQASALFNLAALTVRDMCKAGDLSRQEVETADILQAALLMGEWRAER